MTRVFVVEDEDYARRDLVDHITTRFPQQMQIVGEASDVSGASNMIPATRPDILLMDIDLPDGNAFDILKTLGPGLSSHLIFITAYGHFALRAIKFSALDYILKPWDASELDSALTKALTAGNPEYTRRSLEVLSERDKLERIALKTSDRISLVPLEDIIRLEADGNYTRFLIQEEKPVLISRTLKEYEELLAPAGFFRVHQSHLVNTRHISSYYRHDGGNLQMSDGSTVPVSQRKKDRLAAFLDSFPQ